jgi:transcription termination factor NusB
MSSIPSIENAVRHRKKSEFQLLFQSLLNNKKSAEDVTSLLLDICESNEDYIWLNEVMLDKD